MLTALTDWIALAMACRAAADPAAVNARTLCAAHWAALEASAEAAEEAAADAAGPSKCSVALQGAAESVVASLLRVAEALPFLVGADFLRPAHTALQLLAQVCSMWVRFIGRLWLSSCCSGVLA